MDQTQPQSGEHCSCPHHKMVPIFIVLIGLAFLLNALGVLSDRLTALAWPTLLMLIGLQKLFGGCCKCCK
jgi:hypothetical protein